MLIRTMIYNIIFRKMFVFFLVLFILLYLKTPINAAFTKNPSNPLIVPIYTWENLYVTMPNVIYQNNLFKLWYTGYDGSRYQIGYSYSDDGVIWNRVINIPVLSLLSLYNKDSHEASVVEANNRLEMFYVSSDNGGSQNFKINRAISINDTNWTDNQILIFNPINAWGSSSGSGPYAIYKDNTYTLWFTAPDTGKWSIGVATSTDGLNWNLFQSNPVITPNSTLGELSIGAPSVIYKDSQYHIYYTVNQNGTNIIKHRVSSDGFDWSDNTETVLLPGSAADWDSTLGDVSVLDHDGRLYMYYNAWGPIDGVYRNRIGLATDPPLPTPTPTPEPTPDQSPTPTPTPTLTPTPMPAAVTKVIVIPGLAGSWNSEQLINCTFDPDAVWTNWDKSEEVYQPLISSVSQAGFTPLQFHYDWRRNVIFNALKLKQFITANTNPGEKVHVVGHSLGGLIARAYIEAEKESGQIDKFISVGSPHKGTVLAYPVWSAGEIKFDDIDWRLGGELLKFFCRLKGNNDLGLVRLHFPVVQDLLPEFTYLYSKKPFISIPLANIYAQNDWLETGYFPPYFTASVYTVSGYGQNTRESYTVNPPSKSNITRGEWLDGKPTQTHYSTDGDNTVLTMSAQLSGVSNLALPLNHHDLIRSQTGVQSILNILTDSAFPQILVPESKTDSALIAVSDSPEIIITDSRGNKTRSVTHQVTLVNPDDDNYSVEIADISADSDRHISFGILSPDGSAVWKEFRLSQGQKRGMLKTGNIAKPEITFSIR